MLITFSKRHKKAIESKKLKIRIEKPLRNKIHGCMKRHDHNYGWDDMESVLYNDLPEQLKYYLGTEELKAYHDGNQKKPINTIDDLIIHGWPVDIIDAIETYANALKESGNERKFIENINKVFKSEGSPLRFLDEQVVVLDSMFMESEVLCRADGLFKTNFFDKASNDFLSARENFTSGHYDDTIMACNNALESAIKSIIDTTKTRQKELIKSLNKSEIIPNYFGGFIDHFDGLLQSSFTIANKTRHGDKEIPKDENQVDKALASFVLHLTGTLLVFIMERYEEKCKEEKTVENDDDDDIPF